MNFFYYLNQEKRSVFDFQDSNKTGGFASTATPNELICCNVLLVLLLINLNCLDWLINRVCVALLRLKTLKTLENRTTLLALCIFKNLFYSQTKKELRF